MGFEMRKKRKYKRTEKFVAKMKKIQEEVQAVLKKSQKEIKKYVDKKKSDSKKYRVGDLVLLSTKNLKQQMEKRQTKKLTERYIGSP